jgi:hypothetical protein
MRRVFVIACLVVIAVAAIYAVATQASNQVQTMEQRKFNGVTPTVTPAPTQVPTLPTN